MGPDVDLQLCGELRVEVDGRRRERELPGRLGRLLLAYLVLNRHRAVTRDELIDALWAQGAPDDPGATLSTLLSALRRTLGPELVVGRSELRLVLPANARLDVEQAARDVEGGEPERALAVLEQVLLPELDAPWLDERRRELEEQRLRAFELAARAALARGDARAAEVASGRLVALAPYREAGYALLMEAQEAQGNVAEALRTFERLRALVRDELGAVPSPELRAAHARLLEPPPALPLPPALSRLADRRFVGRAGVLALLRDRLARGGRQFVFLTGEPGIGKTSVVAAFAREAHERGDAVVLYGRSDEDALTPYGPFPEILSQCLAREVLTDQRERGLERYWLFEAVTAALAELGPLVLVCDDLHWADRPTLQLVRHLARASRPHTLLFVGTYREAEAPLRELIADLRREQVFEGVSLAGLDDAEAGKLLAGLSESMVARLVELAGGNPLFLDELRRSVTAAQDPAHIAIPEGIKDVVLGRVARLGERAHDALTLAAVAGETFSPAILGSSDAVLDVLDEALNAGLLTPTDEPFRLAFAHALIRQTLYESISETRRIHLHHRVAERLEASGRRDPAELAHHFFRARHVAGPEPAIRYARQAAARAAASLAWEDEALQLERALEADPPDPGERVELLLALGEARMRGGLAAGRTAFAEAARLARGRSAEQLARAAIGYGGRYYEAGVVDDELIALLREALAELPEGALRCRVLARLAEILHFAGELDTSRRLSEEAVAIARGLGDGDLLAAALTGRHVALLHVAHVDERIAIGREVLALADRARNPRLELQALHARIFDRLTLGDLLGARQDLERLDALAQALREPLFAHFVVGWSCVFAQFDGRLDEAERLALESFELRRELETRDAGSVLAAQLFMIRRAQGRVGELLPAVLEAVQQSPALAAWRAALPLVHLAAGEEERAREALARVDPAAIPRDFFWLTALTLLSEAAAALRAPTSELYRLLEPFAGRFVQIGYAAGDGPVARSLGLLAAASGDAPRAAAHLEHALALCSGAPALELRARADLAVTAS
ncbi:AAA family ATPase [Solirubrobacter ginsenosidimutans]|uniref:AAA family ATPase n=1 Tax=Solirubrobacter ginsenosidimutans TaxID=490573 RepID=A0A9X3S0G5_9ACTN|nr:AAA family ATPase [Solirubrobacter ginsenosidimutans]MDA0159196.1 AAA family ATPase [Solirubrobacter ginsenosidimutans]